MVNIVVTSQAEVCGIYTSREKGRNREREREREITSYVKRLCVNRRQNRRHMLTSGIFIS